MLAWTLFVNPAPLSPSCILWLVIPLCFSVAIIHRTLRAEYLSGLWRRILRLTLQIVIGLGVLATVMWLALTFWPK
jgi:hypothetical protein